MTAVRKREAVHRAQVRLQRSLTAITIGSRQAERRLEAEIGPLRAGDMSQAVHIALKGNAGSALSATNVTTMFHYPFLTRILVDEDDVEPTEPTFGFGYELQSDAPVMISACVRDWLEDERGLIVGARLQLLAVAPGATAQLPFNAVAHLTFMGFAAPDDDDDDQANPVPEPPESIPQ